nr:type I CRISPR-associated protein Cas7 [Odoribacter splanchnicus]
MSNTFKNRVFGCVVIKSVNSNYNADFSHQPRTLPDGAVYATDKALKYTVRNYIDKNYPEDKVFYFKSLNGDMQPRDLDQNYARFFGDYPKADKKEAVKARKVILGNLLSCLDVRLFGGTFASKTANLSIHGVVQPQVQTCLKIGIFHPYQPFELFQRVELDVIVCKIKGIEQKSDDDKFVGHGFTVVRGNPYTGFRIKIQVKILSESAVPAFQGKTEKILIILFQGILVLAEVIIPFALFRPVLYVHAVFQGKIDPGK